MQARALAKGAAAAHVVGDDAAEDAGEHVGGDLCEGAGGVEGGAAVHAGALVAEVDLPLLGPEHQYVESHERHEGDEHRDAADAVLPVADRHVVVDAALEQRDDDDPGENSGEGHRVAELQLGRAPEQHPELRQPAGGVLAVAGGVRARQGGEGGLQADSRIRAERGGRHNPQNRYGERPYVLYSWAFRSRGSDPSQKSERRVSFSDTDPGQKDEEGTGSVVSPGCSARRARRGAGSCQSARRAP